VTIWSAHSVASFGLVDLDDTETEQSGFFFRFDHFAASPDRFVYDANGSFVDNTHYDNPACTGSGSGTASHSPWRDPSGLDMSYGLTRYNASLDMSSEDQFTFNITCNPGGQSTTSAKFFDPLTYPSGGGVPSMSPSDKQVSGSGSISRTGGTVTHTWLFKADVPWARQRSRDACELLRPDRVEAPKAPNLVGNLYLASPSILYLVPSCPRVRQSTRKSGDRAASLCGRRSRAHDCFRPPR
jgi:hypothetical protein